MHFMQGMLQNLNSWLTRASDVQRIASKLQVERAHSFVSDVVAEMTLWALNAIAQENANDSSKSKRTPSKKDVERRIAELLDNSLGDGVGGEGGGVDMVIHMLVVVIYGCVSVVLMTTRMGIASGRPESFFLFPTQASRRLGGSILYHPSYTSPEYATPTNLIPPAQWVGLVS